MTDTEIRVQITNAIALSMFAVDFSQKWRVRFAVALIVLGQALPFIVGCGPGDTVVRVPPRNCVETHARRAAGGHGGWVMFDVPVVCAGEGQ